MSIKHHSNENFLDNNKLTFGNASDLQIFHDASNSYIYHGGTGNLYIKNETDDKDVILQCDDGSGGVTAYLTLDGSLGYTVAKKQFLLDDNVQLSVGTSEHGINMIHDGSNSTMSNAIGDLTIVNYQNDGDIIFKSDDGTGSEAEYFRLDGSTKRVNVSVQMGINAPTTYTAEAAADDLIIGSGSGEVGITIYSGSSNHGSIFFADDLDEEGAGDSPVGARHGKIMYGQDTSDFEFRTGGNQHAATIAHDASSFTGTLQLNNTLTVGEDDTGYDVKFFGDDSGEFMQWDTSEAKLKIVHTDENVGLEVYTNAAAQTTQPQLKVGRAATEYWGVFTADREAAVIHRQDESSGQMKTSFQQWDSNTSDTTGIWQWQYGDGSGGSLTQAMQLSQAGVLTVASLDIGGNVDIDGTTNLDEVDIDGAVDMASTLTVAGNITANGNIVGDNSTNITSIGSVETGSVASSGDNTTRFDMGATQIDCLVADTDVFQVTDSTFTFDPAVKTSIHKRHLAKTSNTDADADGDIVYFGGTTSMDAGKIYYLNSSGNWALADADAESTAKGMLGVALGSASDTNGMLIRGMVTLDTDPGTIGDTLFLSTTAGVATSTAPSGNGDIVRVIGYCLDSTNGQIYFNPDGTFVEVTA